MYRSGLFLHTQVYNLTNLNDLLTGGTMYSSHNSLNVDYKMARHMFEAYSVPEHCYGLPDDDDGKTVDGYIIREEIGLFYICDIERGNRSGSYARYKDKHSACCDLITKVLYYHAKTTR